MTGADRQKVQHSATSSEKLYNLSSRAITPASDSNISFAKEIRIMFGMIPFDRRDDNLFDVFDNFEKKFFGNTTAKLPAFRTDIRDQGDKFLLEAELPGFNKEDISLELKDGILTIKAEHKENNDQTDDKGQYLRRERRYGSFARSFDVSGIDETGITAAYENGVLALTLPKAKPVEPETRRIAIQ